MDTGTVLGAGPLLLAWYVTVGLVVGVVVFVLLVVEGLRLGEKPTTIIGTAVGLAALTVWVWPVVVKAYYDDNGRWRG